MPVQACPAWCQQTPRHLDEASKSSVMRYYMCQHCGHIWTVNKRNPTIVTNVSPMPQKQPNRG